MADTKTKTKKKLTVDEILADYKLPEAVVFIPMDGTALLELERLMVESKAGDDDAAAKAEEVAALVERVKASSRPFHLRAVGHGRWQRLVAANPPKAWQERMDHDPDGLWPEALAEMLVDPVMTVEEVAEMGRRMSEGQWQHLVKAAMQLELGEPGVRRG